MNTIEIANVSFQYNEDGTVKEVGLAPAVLTPTPELITQLQALDGAKDEEIIADNAQLVLAAYFSQLSKIELADPSEYNLTRKILSCEKYENGKLKACNIQFSLTPVQLFSDN